MRAYSQREQEAIAQAALSRQIIAPTAGGTVQTKRENSSEAYELLQTLIDLECESKFQSLVARIEAKLPKL